MGVEKSEGPPKVPAEVEILLGKEPGTSNANMDWEETDKIQSTDEETDSSFEVRRVILDSGIGEGNTPSTSPQLETTEAKSDESGVEAGSDSLTDEVENTNVTGRRRLQKRSRCVLSERSTSTERETDEASETERAGHTYCKRRAGPPAINARRVRLSILMKRGVKELPLPYALKKYVNYGRCFQF
ncbi:hypothetical protein K1T71_003628 [Dendrolimus kikuchii]|uniref:Uncharacterized protein n=1 Tax=Dendrolimus kikuchii TaxID=765133 RepID=A0ACC1D8H0_9NEOP|nr:hypothetical protein K1T71_003628 [Dendrolimus kikuchii]